MLHRRYSYEHLTVVIGRFEREQGAFSARVLTGCAPPPIISGVANPSRARGWPERAVHYFEAHL